MITAKPIGTKAVFKYYNGKSFSFSGIRNGLSDSIFYNAVATINTLQADSAKFIYKVEDSELVTETA